MCARELRVDVGQREEVEVGYRLKVRLRAREKAGDERCLVVHVALRGAVEHVRAAVDNAGGLHQLSPAVHVAVLWTEDGAPGLKRSLDLKGRPFLLTGHPAVIHGGACLREDDLFEPVGSWPSGGRARVEGDAPGSSATGLDRVLKRQKVVPRPRHVVAVGLEALGAVPDESFEVDPRKELICLPLDRAEIDPGLWIVLPQSIDVYLVVERKELALLDQCGHRRGSRR